MNKSDLVSAIASKTLMTKKDTEQTLDAIVNVITDELAKGGKVQIVGFGTFEATNRAEREGRNPQTGKAMTIPASKSAKFSAGKGLKDAVNGR